MKMNLEVIEANQKYVGKNLATLAGLDMKELGIVSGDIIKISGKKELYLVEISINNQI